MTELQTFMANFLSCLLRVEATCHVVYTLLFPIGRAMFSCQSCCCCHGNSMLSWQPECWKWYI